MPKENDHSVGFFAWCEMGHADPDLAPVVEKLLSNDDCIPYWSNQGEYWVQPRNSGHTTIPVLEFLKGLPLNNLVLAYVKGLNPSRVCITTGWQTTDACPQRVTIVVGRDSDDEAEPWIVKSITQEINVGYSCGHDVGMVLNYLKEGCKIPETRPQTFGDTKGLERADF